MNKFTIEYIEENCTRQLGVLQYAILTLVKKEEEEEEESNNELPIPKPTITSGKQKKFSGFFFKHK